MPVYTYFIKVDGSEHLNYTTISIFDANGKSAQLKRKGLKVRLRKRNNATGEITPLFFHEHLINYYE
jgi:hypothetical protein